MKNIIISFFIFIFTVFIISCSSSKKIEKEEIKQEEPKKPIIQIEKQAEVNYDFTGRFLVPNSNIVFDQNDESAIEDPIIGEFVKLKSGDKYTVVFHRFETDTITKNKLSEVIFAFELSNIETNVKLYPEKFLYYYMNYSEKSRIDGKTIHGYLMFEKVDGKVAIGKLDFSIDGVKKVFDRDDVEVTAEFRGNFRIPFGDLKTYKR